MCFHLTLSILTKMTTTATQKPSRANKPHELRRTPAIRTEQRLLTNQCFAARKVRSLRISCAWKLKD